MTCVHLTRHPPLPNRPHPLTRLAHTRHTRESVASPVASLASRRVASRSPPPQATGRDWGNALKQGYREDAGLLCTSDDDEQLILTIPFKQIVNLSSIVIMGPPDGTAPKAVKIFVNKPNLSFDNCNKKATEQLTLTGEQVSGGEQVDLDFTQFQNVRVVSIFVDTNQGGGDVTNISKIVINGAPVHTTNMSELKKC